MNNSVYLLALFLLFSCNREKPQWTYDKKIILDKNVRPLGIAYGESGLWISDLDNERVINIGDSGKTHKVIERLKRPMHITMSEGIFYIPEFLGDTITILEREHFEPMPQLLWS